MKEWKKYKLSEIVLFNPKEKIAKGTIAPKVAMEHLQPFTRDIFRYESTAFSGGSKFRNGDTIMARITPCLENGKTAFISILNKDEIGFGSTEYIVFRNIEGITDSKYIYYFVTNPWFRNIAIKSMVGSSGRQRVQLSVLENLEVVFPPLEEQRRIAGILSALDDKIELNRRINENLEQQAQALFKQWFVDFEFPNAEGKPYKSAGGKLVDSELGAIPEEWKVGCLKDISNIIMGQSPKGESFNEQGNGIVFYQGRTQFGTRYPSVKLYTTEPTRYAEPFSVLLSVRAPVGDVNIATQRCCIGRGVASIQSLNGCNSFIFYIMRCTLQPLLQQYNGEGTVFGCINRKALENIKIIIPPMNIIKNFETIIGSHENLMYKLFLEGNNLVHTRNTLLPKLMNGEITITE